MRRTSARAAVAALTLLVTMTGIASPPLMLLAHQDIPTDPRPTDSGPVNPPGEPPDPAPGDESQAVSPLSRKDLPPGWVGALLSFGQSIGGPSCTIQPDGSVPASADSAPCTLTIGTSRSLRLGTAPVGAVSVTVIRPDGVREVRQAVPRFDGVPILEWLSQPGEPYGQYTLVAGQGGAGQRYTVTVGPASYPVVAVVPTIVRPGEPVTLGLAGFRPGTVVPIHLYQRSASGGARNLTYAYVTTIGPVIADERGEALHILVTSRGDPEDEYAALTEPPGSAIIFQGRGTFALSRTGGPPAWSGGSLDALARVVIEQANQIWTSVIAKEGAPAARLGCAFAGQALDDARGELDALRERRRYREAHLTGPIEVRTVRQLAPGVVEATAAERWQDRLFDADGTLRRTYPERVDRRYVLRAAGQVTPPEVNGTPCPNIFWFVTESDEVRLP